MKRIIIALSSMALSAFADPVTYNWTSKSSGGNFDPGSWDATPDFASGNGIYKFNDINISAVRTFTVNRNINAYGLYLGALKDGDQRANVDGTGELHLGAGGLSLANWSRYWMFSAPIYVEADQTWSSVGQTAQSGTGVYVTGALHDGANGPKTITKTGTNAVWLNNSTGATDFTGSFAVNEGIVYLQGEAPLGTKAKLVISDATKNAQALFYQQAGTLANDVEVKIADRDWNNGKGGAIGITPNNREAYGISGRITYSGTANKLFLSGAHDHVFTLSGGLTGSTGVRVTFIKGVKGSPAGRIVVKDKPWTTSSYIMPAGGVDTAGGYSANGTYGTIEFAVANNTFSSWGIGTAGTFAAYMNLLTSVDWAFNSDSQHIYLGNCCDWELAGTSQRIGNLDLCYSGVRLPRVINSSERPATIYGTQTYDWTQAGTFSGKINLVKDGAGSYVITNVCDVTGDIDLLKGGMKFTATGKWTGLKNLKLSNAATMTVETADAFGDGVRLALATGGKFVTPSASVITQVVETLTIDGNPQLSGLYSAQPYDGVTQDAVHFGGAGVVKVLSSYVEITDGTLSVGENGSVTLAADTVFSEPLERVDLAANSRLTILDPSVIDSGAVDFVVASSAKVAVVGEPGLVAKSFAYGGTSLVGTLTWKGNPAADAFATQTEALAEGQSVFVARSAIAATSTVNWTGGGSDKLMTTAANWNGTANLVDGTMQAVFSAGSGATVVGGTFLNGVTINRGANFTIDAANASSVLRLTSGGIATSGSGTLKLSAATRIEGDQTWNLASHLTVDRPLGSDALSNYKITKTGSGVLYLDSDSTYTGSFDLDDGQIVLRGKNPLGPISADGKSALTTKNKIVNLYNTTVNKKLVIYPDTKWGSAAQVYANEGTSYVNGPVETIAGGHVNITVAGGWDRNLVFTGGLTGNAYLFYRGRGQENGQGMSQLIITNKPWVAGAPFRAAPHPLNANLRGAHVVFAVAGNKFTSIGNNDSTQFWNCADLSTTVDDAITSDTPVYIGNCSTWDLCGTKQHIGCLRMCYNGNEKAVITNSSEKVATLEFSTVDKDWVNRGYFGGKLDVVMNGDKTLTIENEMAAVGSITVNGGTLEFTADGSWKKATALTVNGTGKVTIAKSQTLGRKAEMTLASAASLELAAGVEQQVSKLVVGTTEYTRGEFVFGAGVISVGVRGLTIMVR